MRTAVISACGQYRYRLDDAVTPSLFTVARGRVVWVMLNPSTADATRNDPTMVRVIDFSAAAGFTSLTVVNTATAPR